MEELEQAVLFAYRADVLTRFVRKQAQEFRQLNYVFLERRAQRYVCQAV
jgi:hypothetical protein